jgi:hypothetical protein
MADITVTIPDEIYAEVAAAYHATWPDQTDTPDDVLIQKALVYSVKDTWFAYTSGGIQNSAGPRYNEAAQEYNTARTAIDSDIQAQLQAAQAHADEVFPGF